MLDVGCGVGATPCYLAKEVDYRVLGVNLADKMIDQSRERAKTASVEDRVEFRVADAHELPFEDNLFNAVIMESANIFFDDKTKLICDYSHVTKPGGHVGMTEMTWLKPPSPPLAIPQSLCSSLRLLWGFAPPSVTVRFVVLPEQCKVERGA